MHIITPPLTASPDSTPASQCRPGPRSGLLGLKNRVAAIGGTFRLHSPPNASTWLRVELPLGDRSQ